MGGLAAGLPGRCPNRADVLVWAAVLVRAAAVVPVAASRVTGPGRAAAGVKLTAAQAGEAVACEMPTATATTAATPHAAAVPSHQAGMPQRARPRACR